MSMNSETKEGGVDIMHDVDYLEFLNAYEWKEVKNQAPILFDGTPINASKIIGYCTNATHWGWMNQHLYNKHQCMKKECPFFIKANPEYWYKLALDKKQKKANREKAQLKRWEVTNRNNAIRALFDAYEDIRVTTIKERDNILFIYYIYDKPVDLSEAYRTLINQYNCRIRLAAVATSEENKIELIRKKKKTDLLTIPGVGQASKARLINLGYNHVEDLVDADPDKIFRKDYTQNDWDLSYRMLGIYRIAVKYANELVYGKDYASGRTDSEQHHKNYPDQTEGK